MARAAARWRQRRPDRLSDDRALARTVLLTAQQWHEALADSHLERARYELDHTIAELVRTTSLSVKEIGRTLFVRLDRLEAAHTRFRDGLAEVARFVPPEEVGDTTALLHSLHDMADQILLALVELVASGLGRRKWDRIVDLVARRDRLLHDLIATGASGATEDCRFERSLGLSTAALHVGDSPSLFSRLTAAWARQPAVLDARVHEQFPHLLGGTPELTPQVRMHLTGVLTGSHALPVHAAAVAGRQLTLEALQRDMAQGIEAITGEADADTWTLVVHQRVAQQVATLNIQECPADQMGPACDLYLAVMEGGIRRNSRMVLRLLGHSIEATATLGVLEDMLSTHAEHPACAVLLACINRGWRNATAHAQFRWDPIKQAAVLGNDHVDPMVLATAATRAHRTCAGLQAGVAVALNELGNPHHQRGATRDLVTWDRRVLRMLGESGIEVTSLRREGTTIRLTVPPMSIETARDHLIGVFFAGGGVPDVEIWEIHQNHRPVLILDAGTLTAAGTLTEMWEGQPHLDSEGLELVLVAGGLANSGRTPQDIAHAVIALGLAMVLGERDRLLPRLGTGDPEALTELQATLIRVVRGTTTAETLLPRPARRRLVSFVRTLSTQHDQLGSDQESDFMLPAVHMLARRTRRISLPWLE